MTENTLDTLLAEALPEAPASDTPEAKPAKVKAGKNDAKNDKPAKGKDESPSEDAEKLPTVIAAKEGCFRIGGHYATFVAGDNLTEKGINLEVTTILVEAGFAVIEN